MSLSEHCINRPVFTIVLTLMIMIIGLLHFFKLPLRYLPNIDKPTISIVTDFDGASPNLIEKDITTPIENTLSSISGIDSIRSLSLLGKSRINIDFQLGVDINEAVSDIRNKMSSLQNSLPVGTRAPTVSKNDADTTPIMVIGFQDSNKNSLEITDYINRHIKPVLQEIQGVGEVNYHGAREYAIKIALDPIKMAARQITVSQIKKSLIQQNIDVPSGQIKSHNRNYTVITDARVQHAKKFADLVIAHRRDQLIHLGDLATITVGSHNEDNLLRINGKPAVGLGILAQSTANPIEIAASVRKAIAKISPLFPAHFAADIVFDSTSFIKQSIREVYITFCEAAFFVGAVVLIFLGSFRAAVIPIITIPICLLGVFWPMHWFGFELNTLTLLAIVLAIGLVVDDAIVILENCHRHLHKTQSPKLAAIAGSNEIRFAVLAMTVTLAAVYAPMGFIQGFTGRLFFQFGTTLALCVILSGIIALSLSPMMCSRLLYAQENAYNSWLNRQFNLLTQRYLQSLKWTLRHPRSCSLFLLLFFFHRLSDSPSIRCRVSSGGGSILYSWPYRLSYEC